MAVGWKSLAGIVGAASVVSVGTLYSVLVREPAVPPPGANTPPGNSSAAQPQAESASAKPAGDQATPSVAKQDVPKSDSAKSDSAKPASATPEGDKAGSPKSAVPAAEPPKADGAKPDASKPANGQVAPSFDVARIELGGDAVIAGRAAPGATVELLRNGNAYARAVADVGGQWAIVPPALPKGPCELTLRAISPDGRVILSEQTVSVRVPEKPGEDVVVVLNTPDQPSKVLTDAARPLGKTAEQGKQPPAPAAEPGRPASRANASIRTVEADERGRFFVTGMAEPGASLRIYLNDTLVTGVTAAKDGSFGMTIEKGMQPGNYRVRVDDVAAGSGQVLTRAEVPFAMAEKAPSASAPAVVAAVVPPRSAPAYGEHPAAAPATRDISGAAAAKPAAAVAPAQGASPASEPAGAGATGASQPPTQIAAGQPAPGAGGGARPADTPAASNPATPQAVPVQTGEAKPTEPTPPPSVAVIPEIRTTTIAQGDNLWRISRKIYGQGIRYTWIYDANTDQIRNPNLIYPGQIFVMPDKKDP